MELLDNLHLASLNGVAAFAVIVMIAVLAALLFSVFIVVIVRAIKEKHDAQEAKEEDEFYKQYGLNAEEMRLNLRLTRLRGEISHTKKEKATSEPVGIVKHEEEPAPEEPAAEPVQEQEPEQEPAPVVEEPKAEEPKEEPKPEPQPEPEPEPQPEPEPEPQPEPEPVKEPEPEPQPEPVKEEPKEEPKKEEPPKVEAAPEEKKEAKPEDVTPPAPKKEEPKEEEPLPEDDAPKAEDAGHKKAGVVKPATKKVVKKKPDDWSKYEGDYEGYYYDPEDACYYEGTPSPALAKKLEEKRKELEAQNAKGDKKVVIKKVAPPFATLKTPKHERKAPKAVAGFDESVIYGKYVIEHTGGEYYYTLYDSANKALYTSGNYSSLEYCKRAITRFKTHVLVGTYTTESVDGKFCCVIKRKTYTHRVDPVATFDEAEALKKQIKSFAQTDIIREQ